MPLEECFVCKGGSLEGGQLVRCDHRGCGLVRPAPRPVLHPTRRAPTPDSLTEELRARTQAYHPECIGRPELPAGSQVHLRQFSLHKRRVPWE